MCIPSFVAMYVSKYWKIYYSCSYSMANLSLYLTLAHKTSLISVFLTQINHLMFVFHCQLRQGHNYVANTTVD